MIDIKEFNIKIYQEEDGSYYAEVANLPGCFTMGESMQELNVNLKEAIECYLLSLQKDLKKMNFNFTKQDLVNA